MKEKILEKMPCIKRLYKRLEDAEKQNRELTGKLAAHRKANGLLEEENREYAALIGFLVNENHVVMEDRAGRRYVPIRPERLKTYENGVRVKIKETVPAKGCLLYAEKRR